MRQSFFIEAFKSCTDVPQIFRGRLHPARYSQHPRPVVCSRLRSTSPHWAHSVLFLKEQAASQTYAIELHSYFKRMQDWHTELQSISVSWNSLMTAKLRWVPAGTVGWVTSHRIQQYALQCPWTSPKNYTNIEKRPSSIILPVTYLYTKIKHYTLPRRRMKMTCNVLQKTKKLKITVCHNTIKTSRYSPL